MKVFFLNPIYYKPLSLKRYNIKCFFHKTLIKAIELEEKTQKSLQFCLTLFFIVKLCYILNELLNAILIIKFILMAFLSYRYFLILLKNATNERLIIFLFISHISQQHIENIFYENQ